MGAYDIPVLNINTIIQYFYGWFMEIIQLGNNISLYFGSLEFSLNQFLLALFVTGLLLMVVVNVVHSSAISIGDSQRVVTKKVGSAIRHSKGGNNVKSAAKK